MFDPNTLNQKMGALGIKFVKGKASLDHLYSATLPNTLAVEAKEWCESYFKNKWVWGSPFQRDTTTFYFATEEDLLFFKVRYMGFLIS
jgi:hypothetical protein